VNSAASPSDSHGYESGVLNAMSGVLSNMTSTSNADKLNGSSLRMSSRKRKAPVTIIISDDEGDSDYEQVTKAEDSDDPYDAEIVIPAKRKPAGASRALSLKKAKKDSSNAGDDNDIENVTSNWRPHAKSYHDAERVIALKDDLLQWFDLVR
jgi:hypothetical protein